MDLTRKRRNGWKGMVDSPLWRWLFQLSGGGLAANFGQRLAWLPQPALKEPETVTVLFRRLAINARELLRAVTMLIVFRKVSIQEPTW